MKAPELQPGPLAVIGDVHGEFEALEALLAHIDEEPLARGLVFVGDLVDRGPDSPGVLRRVHALVDTGRAQVVLGNHELNLLRVDIEPKADNGWLRGEARTLGDGSSLPEQLVTTEAERSELLAMLADLPVALEREDLRVVHAAWDAEAIETLLTEAAAAGQPATPAGGLIERHNASLLRIRAELDRSGLLSRAREEARAIHAAFPIDVLGTERSAPPISLAVQERELALQNTDPLRRVTSGPETPASATFAAGGKWRHTRRARWWRDYTGPTVAFGHFWRGITRAQERQRFAPPDPFEGEPAVGPLGRHGQTNCLDYSVGRRFLERRTGLAGAAFQGRLAALLWPENVTLFDDGQRVTSTPPRST